MSSPPMPVIILINGDPILRYHSSIMNVFDDQRDLRGNDDAASREYFMSLRPSFLVPTTRIMNFTRVEMTLWNLRNKIIYVMYCARNGKYRAYIPRYYLTCLILSDLLHRDQRAFTKPFTPEVVLGA